jgi:hypothetical protein
MENKKKRKLKDKPQQGAVMDRGQHGATVGSITRETGQTQNTPPPIEHCPAPFQGLHWVKQCGSTFDRGTLNPLGASDILTIVENGLEMKKSPLDPSDILTMVENRLKLRKLQPPQKSKGLRTQKKTTEYHQSRLLNTQPSFVELQMVLL